MTLTCLRAGGSGIMSGASNIIPDIITEIYANYETNIGRPFLTATVHCGSPPLRPQGLAVRRPIVVQRPAGHPSIDQSKKTLRANLRYRLVAGANGRGIRIREQDIQ